MDWTETNSYLKGIINKLDKLHDPVRIAAFDLDDTIIHRPKGRVIDKKWKLISSELVTKIKELILDDYIIVIFTNQAGMGNGKNFKKVQWRQAMDDLANILVAGNKNYYFAVYVAKTYDLYRKPNIGLWDLMKYDLKDEFNLNKLRISKNSFFCGDAAGRIGASRYRRKLYPKASKGDFSDTDRKFAINIKIQFLTPEQLLGASEEEEYKLTGINPQSLIDNASHQEYHFEPRKKEMILMIGPPGSGKSEFVRKYILPHNYVHVSQDICKTRAKCLKLTKDALEEGKSVVIDNTNPNVLARMDYTYMALEHGYKHIRAIIMNTDIDIAKHLNNVRHVYSQGTQSKINKIVYNLFNKNYVKPIKTEYFDKIETVNFSFDPEKLDDPLWKKIFLRLS